MRTKQGERKNIDANECKLSQIQDGMRHHIYIYKNNHSKELEPLQKESRTNYIRKAVSNKHDFYNKNKKS